MLHASSDRTLVSTHRVAAWNTLCAAVDRCVESGRDGLRQLIWDDEFWFTLLRLYLDQSQYARPKSSKQLLSSLSSAWLKTGSNSKDPTVLFHLIDFNRSQATDPRTKACLQALVHFLSKDVLTLDVVLRCPVAGHPTLLGLDIAERMQHYLFNILQLACNGELGSLVGQLITVSLDRHEMVLTANHDDISSNKAIRATDPVWRKPLSNLVELNTVEIDDLRLYVFPVLFKRNFSDYRSFLESTGLERLLAGPQPESVEVRDGELLYAAIQSGKELGLLYEIDDSDITYTESYMLIPVHHIARLLCNHSRSARLAGLSFLVSSHSMTRPFSNKSLQLLRRYLNVFMGDTNANFRGEVFTLMQRLMDRFRAITHASSKRNEPDSRDTDTVRSSEHFLQWLLRFLCSELRSVATYQRHISALRTLLVMVKSGLDPAVPFPLLSRSASVGGRRWPFDVSILTPSLRRLLLSSLLDPFDDVRQVSATILSMYTACQNVNCSRIPPSELRDTIRVAEASMLASGRADHADGVAHLYSLLYRMQMAAGVDKAPPQPIFADLLRRLELVVEMATLNLYTAIERYPLHGILTTLRYIISSHYHVFDGEDELPRLVNSCHKIWLSVHHVLCNDAPEGYTLEDAEQMLDVTTKDILSYCWRALKESSLLIATLMSNTSTSAEQRLELSELCFTQLAELRHRGAFSTVAQTWTVCCLTCARMEQHETSRVLLLWYEKIIQILNANTVINTRRSAGIPSLICGLLTADISGSLMTKTFADLSAIASKPVQDAILHESSLPQVHALNCAKEILKTSRLGEQSERFIPQSLNLAATSLRSKTWAVQNCGLMLLRAVIDRLLGTSDTHLEGDRATTSLIPFTRHPELLATVLSLLESSSTSDVTGNEGVFPALHLLQGLEIPQDKQLPVEGAVFALTGSMSWHIRDKAARVYAAISITNEATKRISDLLTSYKLSTNATHGALLSVKYILVRGILLHRSASSGVNNGSNSKWNADTAVVLHELAPALDMARSLYHHSNCPVIQAACIDILAHWIRLSREKSNPIHQRDQTTLSNGQSVPERFHSAPSLVNILKYAYPSASPILRQSAARALAVIASSVVSDVNYNISEQVLSLSRIDPNACFAFFTDLNNLQLDDGSKLVLHDHLSCGIASILGSSCDVQLRCSILEFILKISDGNVSGGQISGFLNAITRAPSPGALTSNQLYADLWIQAQALTLEYRSYLSTKLDESDDSLMLASEGFVKLCSSAVKNEILSLCGREAVALSLSRIASLWKYLRATKKSIYQELCLCIYDLLNDDDEDIRLIAARVESCISHINVHPGSQDVFEPTEARSRLLRLSLDWWSTDEAFAREAFARAFKFDEDNQISVACRIRDSPQANTALFAEEKQNLYLDVAIEVKAWSDVALRLQPYAIPPSLLRQFAGWVSDGLHELSRKVSEDPGGPLGWTTEPNIFVIGLQVIYGAQVLLHLAESGLRFVIRPSVIRQSLVRLATSADAGRMNGLWTEQIARVLDKVVRQTWVNRARLLGYVASRVDHQSR